jgi:hypothetical protein
LLDAIVGALIDAAITAMTGAYKAWESAVRPVGRRFAAHYREGYEGGGVYPLSRSPDLKVVCAIWVISYEHRGVE